MQIARLTKKTNCAYQQHLFQMASLEEMIKSDKAGDALRFFDDTYLIVWLIEGAGQANIDLEIYSLSGNTVYFAKPGQVMKVDFNGNADGYIMSFTKEFLELSEMKSSELFSSPFFTQFGLVPPLPIRREAFTLMITIAENLLQEYKSYLDLRSEVLRGFLKIMMIYICRQVNQEREIVFWGRKADLTKMFFVHLEKNFKVKKLVKEYAEMLTVSPNYLNDVVREISGFTASHQIQQRVVLEAKRMALFEGYSLKETAYILGFLDPSNFSKYFKNSCGINFTDFKKRSVSFG